MGQAPWASWGAHRQGGAANLLGRLRGILSRPGWPPVGGGMESGDSRFWV